MNDATQRDAKSTGRTVGLLLLFELAAALTLPFILWRSLITSQGYLTGAAENAVQIRAGVALSFVGAALTVSLAITAWPVFRRYSNATALWFLAACIFSGTLDAVHNATVLSMLSLSRNYVTEGAANPALYQALSVVVATTRRWAHVTQLVGFGVWIFVFYSTLLRFALIPRALAALGLTGIVLQFTGVTLMMFLSRSVITGLALPLLPVQITVAVWLMVKGFKEGPRPLRVAAQGDESAA